ncbi:hypothetical protein Dip510_000805 [Elusimicrobium posterum]|uniref:hypothetical protein n=1 Tax=Elusimicrobium posterum TaxID=3116653 RepID=UPI003C78EB09
MCKKIFSVLTAIGMLLVQFPYDLYAQKSIQAVTYYPTPYGAYNNVDADTVVVKDTLEINTIADVERLNVTGTLKGNINRLEAGNAVVKGSTAAAPTIKATQKVHVANESTVAGITAEQANVANTFYLDGLAFPYAKAIDPAVSNMSWKQITYYTDKTNKKTATRTFLVLDDNGCQDTIGAERIWDGKANYALCDTDETNKFNCTKTTPKTTCTDLFRKDYKFVVQSRVGEYTSQPNASDDTVDGNPYARYSVAGATKSVWGNDIYFEGGKFYKDYIGTSLDNAGQIYARDVNCCGCTTDYYGTPETVTGVTVHNNDTCDGGFDDPFTCGDNSKRPVSCTDIYDYSSKKQTVSKGTGTTTATPHFPHSSNRYTYYPATGVSTSGNVRTENVYQGEYGPAEGSRTKYIKDKMNEYGDGRITAEQACIDLCNSTVHPTYSYYAGGSGTPPTAKDSSGQLICGRNEVDTLVFNFSWQDARMENNTGYYYRTNTLTCKGTENFEEKEVGTAQKRTVECCQEPAKTAGSLKCKKIVNRRHCGEDANDCNYEGQKVTDASGNIDLATFTASVGQILTEGDGIIGTLVPTKDSSAGFYFDLMSQKSKDHVGQDVTVGSWTSTGKDYSYFQSHPPTFSWSYYCSGSGMPGYCIQFSDPNRCFGGGDVPEFTGSQLSQAMYSTFDATAKSEVECSQEKTCTAYGVYKDEGWSAGNYYGYFYIYSAPVTCTPKINDITDYYYDVYQCYHE